MERSKSFLPTCLLLASLLLSHGAPAQADHKQSCQGRIYSVADNFSIVCSASWMFTGSCNGVDMWESWTVKGQTTPKDAFIRPWLDEPITIIGYELVKLGGDGTPGQAINPSTEGLNSYLRSVYRWTRSFWQRHMNETASWFSVGSAMQPDAMVWLGPGQYHAKQMWASGLGEPWPSKDK